MKQIPDKGKISQLLAEVDDSGLIARIYVFQLGETFVRIALLENAVLFALSFCRRIRLKSPKKYEADDYRGERYSYLSKQPFGELIKVLEENNFPQADVRYLRFVKRRRDHFVHRFFEHHPWPGETAEYDAQPAIRRLARYSAIFERAASRVYPIVARAGYAREVARGEWGALYSSSDDPMVGSLAADDEVGK